jgi:hypothetical protein
MHHLNPPIPALRSSAPFLLAVFASLCALADSFNAGDYTRSQELHTNLKIYWRIDGTTMKMALETTATGWVAFGLAEMGRMPGADIVYYEASTNTLTDAYALGFVAPVSDSCQSWVLVAAETVGGKMRVEMSRPLTNEDPSDRNFVDDNAWPLEPTKVHHATLSAVGLDWGGRGGVRTLVQWEERGGLYPRYFQRLQMSLMP